MLDNPPYSQSLRDGENSPLVNNGWVRETEVSNPVTMRGETLGTGWPLADDLNQCEKFQSHSADARPNSRWTQSVQFGSTLPSVGTTSTTVLDNLSLSSSVVKPRVAGQIVLFRKIMDDWGFRQQEAGILLGAENPSAIQEIYDGWKAVATRDAIDRLRAVLRIAADLDALFQDVVAIRDWLNEMQRDLNGTTPRMLLLEGSMENLLKVKLYLSFLSGR